MIDLYRKKILNFLQWNDKNGYYTDEICYMENIPKLSLKESIKFFFGVINSDFLLNRESNFLKHFIFKFTIKLKNANLKKSKTLRSE